MSFIERVCLRFARRVLGNEIAVLTVQRDAALSRVEELEKGPREIQYAIHRDTFQKLVVDKIEQPLINSSTTDTQAAYLVGIQRALSVVERELVIG